MVKYYNIFFERIFGMKESIVFRVAEEDDANAVADIYEFAKKGFKDSGIPQWQDGKPDKESFLEDIQNGIARVLVYNGEIAATCQFVIYEPTYDSIVGGKWSTDSYVAVHRVAVDGKYRRKGFAGMMLKEAENYARSIGKESVRIDTHEKNIKMRSMLAKNGYEKVGTIFLTDGSPRFSFEKLI